MKKISLRCHIALDKLIEYEDNLEKKGEALVWGKTLFGHDIPGSQILCRTVCSRCHTPMRVEAEDVYSDRYCEICSPKHSLFRGIK